MADPSSSGRPTTSNPPPSSSASKLTRSALTAHDKALAVVSPSPRPYTPAAGLTSRRYSTSQRMTMTIPISPPPSVSGKSQAYPHGAPSSGSPQSPIAGYNLPMTPSASTVSGQSRRASLTSSQSVAHAYGFTTATSSAPSRYFPLPSPVDPRTSPGASTTVPKVPTPNLDTIQEVSSSGSGSNSRSGSTVARGAGVGGPPTPTGSIRSKSSPRSRANSLSARSAVSTSGTNNSRRPSTNKSSYFTHWEPGAAPMAIYDPDYPDGSPECLSPRRGPSSASTTEEQEKDYFSQPIRPQRDERSSPRPRRHTVARTLVSSSPPMKIKDTLPPTPGDVISITPSPPTSTKCDSTPYADDSALDVPLSLSEFSLSNNRMGSLDTIFGRGRRSDDPVDEKGILSNPSLANVPWNEMPQYIRRHNRELERREREREKIVAKDAAVRDVRRKERMTVTEARLVAGEWKMMDEIPPTLEIVQRAGREEEKRMCVRIDGSVELVGIGFLRDLPEDEQRRLLEEREELEMWLKGEQKEKPRFLLDEREAYERRLVGGGRAVEGKTVALIEAPESREKDADRAGRLASVVEVDESLLPESPPPYLTTKERRRRTTLPVGT